MIIDYARRFWYRTKTVGKDGTTQIEVKWMPEAKGAYALWKSEGLIGPFDTEIEAISDYLNNVYGVSLALSENSDDAPDPLEEIEIEHAEMGDAEDYDQLRIERGEFETENYQLKQQLAAVTAERDKLREAATYAMNFVDRLGADSPVVFGGEADVYHKLRAALGFDSE